MNLSNTVILVTGGAGLLGSAIVSDIRCRGGTAVCADLACSEYFAADSLHLDMREADSIADAVEKTVRQYGKIDGLVNCAYPRTLDWDKRFEDIPLASWRANVDMQLNSCFVLCRGALTHMVAQKKGSIVLLGSIYGVVGNDFSLYSEYGGTSPAAYSAIKGGIINFTRYLASYYGEKGVRVNCVSPGGIKDETRQEPSFIRRYESKTPLRRLGRPEDVAPAVSFLLSDCAGYITGQNILIDGGWTAI
jgi:NAD(P)-dependent dehydrogenase (short-subunit alcohol dehydrogenase family)